MKMHRNPEKIRSNAEGTRQTWLRLRLNNRPSVCACGEDQENGPSPSRPRSEYPYTLTAASSHAEPAFPINDPSRCDTLLRLASARRAAPFGLGVGECDMVLAAPQICRTGRSQRPCPARRERELERRAESTRGPSRAYRDRRRYVFSPRRSPRPIAAS